MKYILIHATYGSRAESGRSTYYLCKDKQEAIDKIEEIWCSNSTVNVITLENNVGSKTFYISDLKTFIAFKLDES